MPAPPDPERLADSEPAPSAEANRSRERLARRSPQQRSSSGEGGGDAAPLLAVVVELTKSRGTEGQDAGMHAQLAVPDYLDVVADVELSTLPSRAPNARFPLRRLQCSLGV